MEPIVSTSSAPLPAGPVANPPLPRAAIWTAVIIAAALPAILLISLIVLMVATNYNFLNWME